MKKIIWSCSLALVMALSLAPQVRAQGNVEAGYQSIMRQGIIFGNICTSAPEPGKEDSCACRSRGQCSLGDILQLFVNISILILALSGSIALLMFFYGGLMWVIAAGNEKRVTEGKETMTHAVIGLAIIFGAYALVNFIIAGLSGRLPGASLEETINASSGNVTADYGACNQALYSCDAKCVADGGTTEETSCSDVCDEKHMACIRAVDNGTGVSASEIFNTE